MTRKICSVLSMVVFLGLLVIAGFLFVPKMLGYDEYAVLSGSMEPGIPVVAIVYDKNFAASEAREGAVVTSVCSGEIVILARTNTSEIPVFFTLGFFFTVLPALIPPSNSSSISVATFAGSYEAGDKAELPVLKGFFAEVTK